MYDFSDFNLELNDYGTLLSKMKKIKRLNYSKQEQLTELLFDVQAYRPHSLFPVL